jgi:hypothetical protein
VLKSIALPRSGFDAVPEANPVGGVGWAEVLNQGITGFFMELLQAACHNPKLALSRVGFDSQGRARSHIKNNLTHKWVTSFLA